MWRRGESKIKMPAIEFHRQTRARSDKIIKVLVKGKELTLAASAECRHFAISSPVSSIKLSLEGGGGWARNGFDDSRFQRQRLCWRPLRQGKCGGDRLRTDHLVMPSELPIESTRSEAGGRIDIEGRPRVPNQTVWRRSRPSWKEEF
jgi:hypothetical protein